MTSAIVPVVDARPLSHNERILLEAVSEAAAQGAPCPSNEDLAERMGCEGLSTPPGILARLQRRGILKVERYQRSRRIIIMATGHATAQPSNRTPHWRDRPRAVPGPSLAVIRQRDPEPARQLMIAARAEGRDLQDFLADMVWLGFRMYREGKGEG